MRGDSEFTLQVLIMVIFAAAVVLVLFMLTTSGGKGVKASGFGIETVSILISLAGFQFLQMKGALALTAKQMGVILLIVLLALIFIGLWSGSKESAGNMLKTIVDFFNKIPGG